MEITTLGLFIGCVIGCVIGLVIYKYVIKLFSKFSEQQVQVEKKLKEIKGKVEYQLDVAKEKGYELEGELEEIKDDLEDMWNIIKR